MKRTRAAPHRHRTTGVDLAGNRGAVWSRRAWWRRTASAASVFTLVLVAGSGAAAAGASRPAPTPAAAADAGNKPLFAENRLLSLTIRAPFQTIRGDRVGPSDYHPGLLQTGGEAARSVPVEVRARGKTRRRKEICSFPPLRLRFDPESDNGLFAGQRAVKLVTHCQDLDRYDQLVLQEYLAYRLLNLLTPYSHRVRLADVRYESTSGRLVTTRKGILLEHWRDVAARTGAEAADIDGGVNVTMLSAADANLVDVFQFFIGNQDYSLNWPEPRENCCHNSKPLFADGWVIPLPYDFDFAGIVDAPYAKPKRPNRNVRSRRYEGLCAAQHAIDTTLARFQAARATIYALYRDFPGINERRRASTLDYIDAFYAIIADPAEVERRLTRRCKAD